MKNLEINVAETSGFCFGVGRAISSIENLLAKNKKVCTLGPIIHNPLVINDLKSRGVKIIDNVYDMPENHILVVRAHGIVESVFNFIKDNNIKHIDATCPFVKKIHNIVKNNSPARKILFLAGDKNHPEVKGIQSYFEGYSIIFNNCEELKNILDTNIKIKNIPAIMVAQTTFSASEWKKCVKLINNSLTNIKIFDTICNTTSYRQSEAQKISKNSDLMIVVGGKQSSNTQKLYRICAQNTRCVLLENFEDLYKLDFSNYKKIGIIAGASTPMNFVKKICEYLEKQNC